MVPKTDPIPSKFSRFISFLPSSVPVPSKLGSVIFINILYFWFADSPLEYYPEKFIFSSQTKVFNQIQFGDPMGK